MIDPAAATAFEALLERRGGEVLLLVDGNLRIVRAGPEAASLAQRDRTQLPGMSLIAAFGSASLDAVARQALVGGEPVGGDAELGHLGSRHFAVDAVPLVSGGLVLLLHDVTALRRMERVRRDFVANISHELRTPLTSIKLLAETISSGAVDELETMRDFASQIEREVDHLAQLVDELLELSTIESGAASLAMQATAPDDVVAETIQRITPVAERREIGVAATPVGPAKVEALADQARLSQALLNLAHNAVKYSHTGGQIRVGWGVSGDRVRFTVADDGIGVPAVHRDRIFERFYKVDRSRSRDEEAPLDGGAGLGLAIVRHIAEAHGGAVGLTSEEGLGSSFWIEVPRAPEAGEP